MVNNKDSLKFMGFFADQISLGWETLLESIGNKIHKKMESKINAARGAKSASSEEEIQIIANVLADEFKCDWSAYFLVNEQQNTLKLEFSNLEMQHQVKYSVTRDTEISVVCYNENKTLKMIGRQMVESNTNLANVLKANDGKEISLEHCLCSPIVVGNVKPGIIGLFRTSPLSSFDSADNTKWIKPPFSDSETQLLKRVQRHVFDIVISYVSAQRRLKYLRNVIDQITAPIKSSLGTIEDILKGKVRQPKYLGSLRHIKKLSQISLKYGTNFEKMLLFDSQELVLKQEILYDLRDYLIGISKEYQPLISKKCISIRVTDQTPDSLDIYVDKEQFQWAIANIIDNTVKYSFDPEERQEYGFQSKPSSNESIENVLITAKEDENQINITISSLGLEILDGEKNKIFNREFRGVKAKERYPVGMGIGLFIAKEIIEAHNGTLTLDSFPGKYRTVFRIVLPKMGVDR
jgi:signal transduction histidine kinase